MKIETVVIVLNYNGFSNLKECFESLRNQKYKKFKTIMVDNNSSDKSVSFVKKNFQEVEIIANKKNFGFSVANNRAISYSIKKYSPKYIALLNNDTVAEKCWLKELIKCCEEEKCCAVASNMLFYANHGKVNSQGGRLNIFSQGVDVNFGKKRNFEKEKRTDVLSACFGAVLLRVTDLKKIGLMDERYFAYFEDLDWGWRANNLGYKIFFEPKAIVYHKGSEFWKNETYDKTLFCRQNGINSIIKNMKKREIVYKFPLIFFGYFVLLYLNIFINFNSSLENSFFKRVKYFDIPFKAFNWNRKNFWETIELRKKLQIN